jgi:hypothetical protein
VTNYGYAGTGGTAEGATWNMDMRRPKVLRLSLFAEARRAKNEVKLYGAVGWQDWLVLFKGNDTKAN